MGPQRLDDDRGRVGGRWVSVEEKMDHRLVGYARHEVPDVEPPKHEVAGLAPDPGDRGLPDRDVVQSL